MPKSAHFLIILTWQITPAKLRKQKMNFRMLKVFYCLMKYNPWKFLLSTVNSLLRGYLKLIEPQNNFTVSTHWLSKLTNLFRALFWLLSLSACRKLRKLSSYYFTKSEVYKIVISKTRVKLKYLLPVKDATCHHTLRV